MEPPGQHPHNPLLQTFGRDQLGLTSVLPSPREPPGTEQGQMHLRNIDEINLKINGLIRSISESCRQQQRKKSVKPSSRAEEQVKEEKEMWRTDYKQVEKKQSVSRTAVGKPSMFSTHQQLPESVSKRLEHRRMHSVEGEKDDEIS